MSFQWLVSTDSTWLASAGANREFHIHGVRGEKDHAHLRFFGENPKDLIRSIALNFGQVPFVLETKGVEIFSEGKTQIGFFSDNDDI